VTHRLRGFIDWLAEMMPGLLAAGFLELDTDARVEKPATTGRYRVRA
jgi:hypothetical protein